MFTVDLKIRATVCASAILGMNAFRYAYVRTLNKSCFCNGYCTGAVGGQQSIIASTALSDCRHSSRLVLAVCCDDSDQAPHFVSHHSQRIRYMSSTRR